MMRIFSIQLNNKINRRPLKGCVVTTAETMSLGYVAHIYYQDSAPILIHDYRGGLKCFRLAFEAASALQRRRIKSEATSSLQNYKELTPDEMNSKVNEILADVLSEELNNQLMGQ